MNNILSVIDLTCLSETATEADIAALCQKAITPSGQVAAICIYPSFIPQVRQFFNNTSMKIATVVNFPQGTDALDDVVFSIQQAIKEGADEIDVVFPYADYLKGKTQEARRFIQQCKAACGEDILLKVILETGELKEPGIIAQASRDALLAGADFLKTSTGKTPVGATLSAATVILKTIRDMTPELNRSIGFKASGGIKTLEQAHDYIDLANKIMGENWVSPNTFRIGASQLVDIILN